MPRAYERLKIILKKLEISYSPGDHINAPLLCCYLHENLPLWSGFIAG
jgi:hypothetical protein